MHYKKFIKKLKGTLDTSPENIQAASSDKSYLNPIKPQFLIQTNYKEDIPLILEFANTNKIPLTIQGAKSGKSGGAIPEKEGIALSLESMNTILNLDIPNRTITVEPGVIVDDIKKLVQKHKLFYPPDPASSDWCTIGGTIAENAGGPSAIKYGVTEHYVLGLKGYFGNGNYFEFGGKCHKNVAGYNLKSLLIGSEGTLAIITEITLKLIPLPQYSFSYWCNFSTITKACNFLKDITQAAIPVTAAEFLEYDCLNAIKHNLNINNNWIIW